MKHALVSLCLALSLLCACSEVDTRTQLTFTIAVSETLEPQVEMLTVLVRSDQRTDQTQDFAKSELNWPVEIVVLPSQGQDSDYEVTLTATAFGAGRTKLGTQTVVGKFAPGKLRTVPVPLGPGAPTIDAGQDNGTKTDAGKPGVTPDEKDAGGNTTPAKDAGQNKPDEPTPDAGNGNGNGVVNCATPGNGIKCDDGNPCNGTERCEPAQSGANNSGCVPGMDAVACGTGATCDSNTGKCSTCLVKPDGDGDGVNSVACMGMDCNDNDETVAPRKDELCDGKDNDCDGTVDGAKANPSCTSSAPMGGTASCVSGRCTPACTNPNFQIENGVCVAPPVTCPLVNPCTPGVCRGGNGSYTCTCPSGFRAGVGMTRCAPVGTAARTIGFEAGCDGMPTPGMFAAEYKALAPTLYAGCGVASIAGGTNGGPPRLIQPVTTMVGGLTGEVALANPLVTTGGAQVAISFSTPVNNLSFDVLDIDSPAGVLVTLLAGGVELPAMMLVPVAPSKLVKFSAPSALAVERVTLTYAPATMTDEFYLDQLAFLVAGCGDKVINAAAGEVCDDGNDVQCDGCDNACAATTASCSAPP